MSRLDAPKLAAFAWLAGVVMAACSTMPRGVAQVVGALPDSTERVTTAAAGIRHVFVLVLENKNYEDTFNSSTQDPYLRRTLVPQGALLTQYYGTGHVSLDNYITLISGQSPTPDTANDCPTFNDVEQTGVTKDGQVIAAKGCVYGIGVRTIVDQLQRKGLSWKGYMEDMGNDPARESATCGHPSIGSSNKASRFQAPSAAVPLSDGYATRHNPFVYFHSIIDSPACNANVINLKALEADLANEQTTPSFALISPNLCNDGHDGSGDGRSRCANGDLGGLASADAFLKTWVPKITASQAYRQGGLLIITFDEGNYTTIRSTDPASGETVTKYVFPGKTCCNQQPGPNIGPIRPSPPANGRSTFVYEGYGGDRVGAVLLSPFIQAGSTSATAYNHYSLLRSLEDIFGLDDYLGYAANDPAKSYVLDTIGNDRLIFKSARKSRAR